MAVRGRKIQRPFFEIAEAEATGLDAGKLVALFQLFEVALPGQGGQLFELVLGSGVRHGVHSEVQVAQPDDVVEPVQHVPPEMVLEVQVLHDLLVVGDALSPLVLARGEVRVQKTDCRVVPFDPTPHAALVPQLDVADDLEPGGLLKQIQYIQSVKTYFSAKYLVSRDIPA